MIGFAVTRSINNTTTKIIVEPIWKFINTWFFPVFVFKQIVSLVALWDSSKTIIELDERERAERKKAN